MNVQMRMTSFKLFLVSFFKRPAVEELWCKAETTSNMKEKLDLLGEIVTKAYKEADAIQTHDRFSGEYEDPEGFTGSKGPWCMRENPLFLGDFHIHTKMEDGKWRVVAWCPRPRPPKEYNKNESLRNIKLLENSKELLKAVQGIQKAYADAVTLDDTQLKETINNSLLLTNIILFSDYDKTTSVSGN